MDGNTSRLRASKEEMPNVSMLQLPAGPLSEIGSYLGPKDLSAWRRTSRGFAQFFKNDLEMAKPITHVLRGEEAAALAILEQSPELLLIKKKSIDYSGRAYYNTPYQAALLSHDVILCVKMEPLFDKLPDGKTEMDRQFCELFPNGIPEQTAYDLTGIMKAITESSDGDIGAVLNKQEQNTQIYRELTFFREQFTALSLEEKFFNREHLILANNIYDQNFRGWNSQQRRSFFSLVIGYMQRFLPAFYLQAHCQGLLDVNLKEKNLVRSLKLVGGPVTFPLDANSGLGFDFGIYSHRNWPGGWQGGLAGAVVDWPLSDDFEKFGREIRQTYLAWDFDYQTQKQASLSEYQALRSNP